VGNIAHCSFNAIDDDVIFHFSELFFYPMIAPRLGGLEMPNILFPFEIYWWFYAVFGLFVIGMLALDLGVFHKKAHVVSMKESLSWSIVWISLAMLFNLGFYFYARHALTVDPRFTGLADFNPSALAHQLSLEFLAGFVIEKTLAIDNIFVFVVVFSFFHVPPIYQHRVLFYGIIGALVMRAGFISLGATLMQYHWVVMVAGVFLVLTGLKIFFAPEKIPDPGKNPLIKLVKLLFPLTEKVDSGAFFVRIKGVLHATPLFLALVFIEFSDVIFAIDSVPAIFAITKEPLIVFTSNIFAILGLRSLYFLLADMVDKFRYLKYGLGLILIFVGLKMSWLNEVFGGKFPISWSLIIIATILAASAILSLLIKPKLNLEQDGKH
jgi:tellurite resistance protein TerC